MWARILPGTPRMIYFSWSTNLNISKLDLHPGNILVRGSLDDPSQIKLVILDSGIVATLSPQDFRNLYDTFKAVIK